MLVAFAGFGVFGSTGCLLFTDPINRAPTVSIVAPKESVVRGVKVAFTAIVTDDRDSPASLAVAWATFVASNGTCDGVTTASWAGQSVTSLASTASYPFTATTLDTVCVCAKVTDSDGASSFACQAVTPINSQPKAVITDVAGIESGLLRPLCSQVHLSAESSIYPTTDPVQFAWAMTYSGSDANASKVTLGACSGVTSDKADKHRCFYVASTGTYTVTLTLTDTLSPTDPTTSNASFVVWVDVDQPPCLRQTDPGVYAQRILLSRSTDLSDSYQTRNLTVLNVADDCDPYPAIYVNGVLHATQFVWSIYDATKSQPTWVYQTNTSDTFQVSQALFPNALPGDVVKVRVEARDAAVQKLYQSGISACSADSVDICCNGGTCTGTDDCVRWTTWTVQFQP